MSSGSALTKSRYLAGIQCAKRLWFEVHEPDEGGELDPALVALLERGRRVGEEVRRRVPGGVVIEGPPRRREERVSATRAALAAGAKVLYEASFEADGVFVAVDLLERKRNGFVLAEVKASLDVKDQHIPDVAIQLHVLRRAGVPVRRAEVMHLNRDCRHPDLTNLFVRKDVTRLAEAALRGVPRLVRSMRATLAGRLPDVATGPHCTEPYACPFLERCWLPLPKHHLSTLHGMRGKKLEALLAAGHETLFDLPRDYPAKGPAHRQIESVRKRRMVVEPGLCAALEALEAPIAFLDFETVAPAIPAWSGCSPYEPVPVQFSCHVRGPRSLIHHEWLAEGPADPRESFARALLEACRGARTVLVYNASFEKRCITALGAALPRFRRRLRELAERLVDLLAIVRDHVYHPRFQGSFSIKDVLPALVPGMGYDDLDIQDGQTASVALEAMLLGGDHMRPAESQRLRRKLREYCKRDTLAMVRLRKRLGELA